MWQWWCDNRYHNSNYHIGMSWFKMMMAKKMMTKMTKLKRWEGDDNLAISMEMSLIIDDDRDGANSDANGDCQVVNWPLTHPTFTHCDSRWGQITSHPLPWHQASPGSPLHQTRLDQPLLYMTASCQRHQRAPDWQFLTDDLTRIWTGCPRCLAS